MRRIRSFLLLLGVAVLAAMSPAPASADGKHVRVSEYDEGHKYCPPRNVIIGNMAVRGGRCYQVAVVRNARGAFLAFLDPTVAIPAGRLAHLDGDEGHRIGWHIISLVPLPMTSQLALVPVNTIQLIRLREEDEEDEDDNEQVRRGTLVVIIPNAPIPNVSVAVVVRF